MGWVTAEKPGTCTACGRGIVLGQAVARTVSGWAHAAGCPAPMRVLTVRQPYAWAIIHGGKDVENRVRNIAGAYRGPVAIHAAKQTATLSPEQKALLEGVEGLGDWFGGEPLVGGAIIGVVDLVDVHNAVECWRKPWKYVDAGLCSPWAEGDVWHLCLANPRPLVEPIPFKGALGLRTLDADVEAAVWAGVAS